MPNAASGSANVDSRDGTTSRIDACIHGFIEAYYLAACAVPRGSIRLWHSHQRSEDVGVVRNELVAYACESSVTNDQF